MRPTRSSMRFCRKFCKTITTIFKIFRAPLSHRNQSQNRSQPAQIAPFRQPRFLDVMCYVPVREQSFHRLFLTLISWLRKRRYEVELDSRVPHASIGGDHGVTHRDHADERFLSGHALKARSVSRENNDQAKDVDCVFQRAETLSRNERPCGQAFVTTLTAS